MRSFSGIKTVFFDTSDTLYTNDALEAAYPQKLVELIARDRHSSETEAAALFDATIKQLEGTVGHVTKVGAMAQLGYTRAQVHEVFCLVRPGDYLQPNHELATALQRLARTYRLGIISNLKRSHMTEVLQALGISPEVFTIFVTEDIVAEIKPHPEPFLKAIELAGCNPAECLYVGDSPTKDMKPAKSVGMTTVLVAATMPEGYENVVDAVIPRVELVASLLQ